MASNEDNARDGAAAIAGGDTDKNLERGEPHTALVDTLANLMHWAESVDVDFDEAIITAEENYQAETARPCPVCGAIGEDQSCVDGDRLIDDHPERGQ